MLPWQIALQSNLRNILRSCLERGGRVLKGRLRGLRSSNHKTTVRKNIDRIIGLSADHVSEPRRMPRHTWTSRSPRTDCWQAMQVDSTERLGKICHVDVPVVVLIGLRCMREIIAWSSVLDMTWSSLWLHITVGRATHGSMSVWSSLQMVVIRHSCEMGHSIGEVSNAVQACFSGTKRVTHESKDKSSSAIEDEECIRIDSES